MGGIVFYQTTSLAPIVDFYTERIDATVWLKQPDCTILDFDGFRFGFCERDTIDDCGILTFVYDDRNDIDAMYDSLAERAMGKPHENDTYEIYQFFAVDPDGRTIEFQTFLHDLP